ncbi:GNAT family N-acetyltransferase [Clostridium sp. FP1]|uniref:GNAT family N-acetyltransferase n=1 Tax=Clostridium sp. FP1 TaxID=2724076 RepID=UPI0013E99E23|nr:GNAT family protein [Clostridium sp. FP1]MBZ9637347.1 GNAT family N-acetyltransferase [Clostridium sp. FP1]
MKILETERLILRKFSCDDWKDLYEYLSQETVVKYEPYEVYSKDACKKEAIYRSQQDAFWAVCLKENNKLIGNIYFQEQEPEAFLTWEIGYVFNPIYYGQGYATEACREILDYGFQQLNARRIVAMCNPENIASWKLLERLNMRREGHLRKNIFFKCDEKREPIWSDTYEYAVLADDLTKPMH